jgi:hypothetical protein
MYTNTFYVLQVKFLPNRILGFVPDDQEGRSNDSNDNFLSQICICLLLVVSKTPMVWPFGYVIARVLPVPACVLLW